MGRCHYDKLKSLEPALAQIRKMDLKEPKPGIFYLKTQGFLHFHEKDEKIWADVKDGANWGPPIDIPAKISKIFINDFVAEVRKRYLKSGGK